MTNLKLYAKQLEGVAKFLQQTTTPRRLILGWKTGCGKTAGAWSIAQAEADRHRAHCPEPFRVLVVCPAIVRRHWVREAAKWAPGIFAQGVGCIEVGRYRTLGKKRAAERAAAQACPSQVVSYALLGPQGIEPEGWNMIILDELHNVAAPRSLQSRATACLLRASPTAHRLGLTATPIPTRLSQMWHPLHLFWGNEWGRPTATGEKISNQFKFKYCDMRQTEYGWVERGADERMLPELKRRLAPCIHMLTREDLIKDLPPLDAELYDLGAKPDIAALLEWYQSLPEDVTHVCLLTYKRADAQVLYEVIREQKPEPGVDAPYVEHVDGSVLASERDRRLEACAAAPRAVLCGTHASLAEGVRLMWVQQAAIFEWSASPGRVLQLLGRFQSVGSANKPHVCLMTSEAAWARGLTLLDRVQDVMGALGEDIGSRQLHTLMEKATAVSDDDLTSMWDDILNFQTNQEWVDDE